MRWTLGRYVALGAATLTTTIGIATCSVDDIQLVGMSCPCPASLVCDTKSKTCVESLSGATGAGGASSSSSTSITTGGGGLGGAISGSGGEMPDGSDERSEADAPEEPVVCIDPGVACNPDTDVCCSGYCELIQRPAINACCHHYLEACGGVANSMDCCGPLNCVSGKCQ